MSKDGQGRKRPFLKKRCCVEGCKKLALDMVNKEPLCRIPSPQRQGFKNNDKKVKKK